MSRILRSIPTHRTLVIAHILVLNLVLLTIIFPLALDTHSWTLQLKQLLLHYFSVRKLAVLELGNPLYMLPILVLRTLIIDRDLLPFSQQLDLN